MTEFLIVLAIVLLLSEVMLMLPLFVTRAWSLSRMKLFLAGNILYVFGAVMLATVEDNWENYILVLLVVTACLVVLWNAFREVWQSLRKQFKPVR